MLMLYLNVVAFSWKITAHSPFKEAVSKARRMLFMIRRPIAKLFVSTFAPIYNTLVGPHLQYAWWPNFVANTDCLEQIRRFATILE